MFFYSEVVQEIIQQIILNQWNESQILSGSLAVNTSDNFGYSVAINSAGNRMVIGATSDEGSVSNQGLAYVFVSGASGWTQQHILSGTGEVSTFNYAESVAINSAGDRIVVGGLYDRKNGGPFYTGLAYVFVSGTDGWTQQHILSGSLTNQGSEYFGASVAINSAGDKVVVGAYGDQRTGGSYNEGLAYVFASGSNGWTQQHILSGSQATTHDDRFGSSVSINSAGDRIVVGAWQDEFGNPSESGAAYIFVSGNNGWTENKILTGSLAINGGDNFGISVSMNSVGDRVVVGSWFDESPSAQQSSGLAYVFVSGANGWSEQHALSGTLATNSSDRFGYSVAINSSGDYVAVGAYQDENVSSPSVGLTYIFFSGSSGWIQKNIISGSLAVDSSGDEYFGHSVSINSVGDKIAVGAPRDEATGNPSQSGLVYVFNGKE